MNTILLAHSESEINVNISVFGNFQLKLCEEHIYGSFTHTYCH
jgi:hypothetical protein